MFNNSLFKVVVIFSYRENYGAHDWSGEGNCPQYWKNKGSLHVTLIDGLTPSMCCHEDIERIVIEKMAPMQSFDDYSEILYAGWFFEPSLSISDSDQFHAEMAGDFEYVELFDNYDLSRLVTEGENAPVDRFDAMAELHGYI